MLDPTWVYFQIPPKEMTFVTRIFEGCEYVGVVTALDGKKGIGFIRTTEDTAKLAREIIQSMPFPAAVLSYGEACRISGEEQRTQST
ncbi:DUF4911 domain-containing protein [uncultured Megasphaera sp.]|uniref:DUF4911 domain-containing protein n=1 Tax=uncultured Megasphaera sp. TaxID=165188 RepID=UPI00265ADFF9|nr:DUF4911 domain-containing protein [uncultured Megasphaera sp.]